MGTKLFVGSLPFETSEEELRTLFEAHGEVADARIITDKFSGKSRGFGFVEMSSEEQAKKAVEQLDGSNLEGRNIVVNEAREREKSRGGPPNRFGNNRGGRGGGGGGQRRGRY